MKKIIVFLIAAVLVLAFASCKEAVTPTQVPTSAPTPEPTPSPTAEPTPQPTPVPTTDQTADISLFYGGWEEVGDITNHLYITVAENQIKKYNGETLLDTLDYTVKSAVYDYDNNIVITLNESESVYRLFASKTGYGAYTYMEITTGTVVVAMCRMK